jgi:polysaccharide export outer membrane protein
LDEATMKRRDLLLSVPMIGTVATLTACAGGTNAPPEPPGAVTPGAYRLGAGDDLRVLVFGQEQLSGQFKVDGSGQISLPLVGDVRAQGRSARELEQDITTRLADGYVRDPQVSVQVMAFRPFFILGEVKTPGQYAYVDGMTAVTAVAMAGGFTYRARQDYVLVTRGADAQKVERRAPVSTPVLPDDVVRVPERFF